MPGTSPVGTFLQSNYTSQTGTVYPLAIDADIAVFARLGDNFAPRPSAPAAMNVTLDPGHFSTPSGGLTEVAAQTTGTIAAPVTNPRIDRIVIDNATGVVSVVGGVENATPVAPAIPAGKSPVAQALLQTASTAITGTMLTDERDFTQLGYSSGAFTTLGTAATQNVGTAAGDVVQLDGGAKLPAVDGSQLTNIGAFTTGDAKLTLKSAADAGWVMMNDGTVGDASSGGTTRANADCSALFQLLWNNITNANCPVSGGRGASAAADWAAHKTIALPKALGRALAIAGAGSGLTSRALGDTTGSETHVLTPAEIPSGLGSFLTSASNPDTGGTGQVGGAGTEAFGAVSTTSGTAGGSGGAHTIMQPTSFLNVMVKL